MEVDEPSPSVLESAAIVQPDWDGAIREASDPKFFVGLRKYGEKSVFLNVEKSGDDFVCSDYDIQISVQQSSNSLHFQSQHIHTVFLSPVSEIRNLHETAIKSIDVSCTGNLIVSADSRGSLAVSNVMNGNRLRDLEGHVMDVYKCRFFPSGLVILSGGIDMSVRVWSVETGTCPRTFKGHTSAVSDLAIIGVGREVLSCSHDGTIVKWLCQDGSVQEQWRPEAGPCNAIAISSDFTMFAVACEERKCVVYSVSGPMLSTIATDNVPTAVCIDCDYYHIVYIGDEQGMVSVYDAKTKSFICRLKTDRAGVIKIMAREEGLFVAFSDGSMCCYARDFSPNEVCPLYEFTGSDCDPIYDFCFNKKHLFTACRDGVVRRYRIP